MEHPSISSGQVILRSQVFKEIHTGEPFDMVFITADRRRGSGGELIVAEGWMKLSYEQQHGGKELKILKEEASAENKDPNHEDHGTINVFNPANAGYHPIKVHYDLIQFFNGKRVIN